MASRRRRLPDMPELEFGPGDYPWARSGPAPAPELVLTPRVFRVPLGLRSDPVTHGTSEQIEVRPYVLCRPETFVLEPEIAHSFELVDLRISQSSQLLSADPLPLDTFSSEYVPPDGGKLLQQRQAWKAGSCSPAQVLTIVVRRLAECGVHADCRANPSIARACALRNPDPIAFRGLLWCEAANVVATVT
jgi:hypothetical protein